MFEEKLKQATEVYWIETQSEPSIDKNLKEYICGDISGGTGLLEAELYFARSKIQKTIQSKRCETLVLLVGLSLEPLLQSICVYKPENIILILNQEGYPVLREGGNEHGSEDPNIFSQHIIKAVKLLVKKGLINTIPDISCHASGANEIFKGLVEMLHDKNDVVVDITGGKKSMVTDAFLYAAFAGARISYVDFDKYSVKNRRPYGFSCKIGELSNPYQEFSLREWENVRIHYNKYHFNEALQLLKKDIRSPMIRNLPYSEEAIDNLIGFIEFYDKWDSGDFCSAKDKARLLQQKINLPEDAKLPSIVIALGNTGDWYKFDSDLSNKPPPIYGDLNKLLPYVHDELARIERLIKYNEDFRSAFMQAGGVNEMIMLGRLLYLIINESEKMMVLDKLIDQTPKAEMVIKAFSNSNKQEIIIGYKGDINFQGFRKKCDPKVVVTIETPMSSWWNNNELFKDNGNGKGFSVFITKRNEVAHKHFPVPKEWAEEGLKFVKANFGDFLKNHLNNIELEDYCTETLPWSKLCRLCGVDFLTPNLRSDE